ncbi:hypothetical protein GQX73_g7331 [Xylaria multiplex]|uniref:Rhodopsin domain-containing protein n=1 Tax=Xylaria multiplex TaxID=323545 RepID=A0A7C8IKW5_9PEZI|nr:hypothetical protein GQX73_g7331 [Xylaria multiplex]
MELDRATLAVTPAAMAPAGMTSNLINPESRAWHVELTIGITLAPALFLVPLRIYARLGLARNLGIDDYICVLAAAFTIAFNGLVLSLLYNPGGGALGLHIWDVSALHALEYQSPAIVESALLRISNTLIKVSILTFYLRIFNPVPRLKIMIWAGLVTVVGFLLAILIGTLILCVPRSGENNGFAGLGIPKRCNTGIPNFTTAGTIFSVISDFYILFIPLHLLPSMKLSRKRKVAVGSVFLVGFFACLAGIANLVIRFARYLPTDLQDFTWNAIDTYITKVAETNIALICACMPVVSPVVLGPMRRLRALFNSWFRRADTSIQGTRGYRDFPVTEDPNGRNPAIPRGTITGLRTIIGKIPGSGDAHDKSTTMSTLPLHVALAAPKPSSTHDSCVTDKSQSSRDTTSVVEQRS